MATTYSNLYGLDQRGNYLARHQQGQKKGDVYSVTGTFTATGALATNDVGILCDVPAGHVLLGFAYKNDDFGNTCTTSFSVGSTDIKTAVALGTASTGTALTAAECAAGMAGNTSATQLKATFTTVTTPTAGAVLTFTATFAVP